MTTAPPLDPGKGTRWTTTVRELVHRLEDTAPAGYDGLRVAPYSAQQTSPVSPATGRPYSREALDLIRRPFAFGERLVVVELTRLAFVGLLRAMRVVPEIEVGFGNGTHVLTIKGRSAGAVSTTSAARAAGGEDTPGDHSGDAGSSPAPRSKDGAA